MGSILLFLVLIFVLFWAGTGRLKFVSSDEWIFGLLSNHYRFSGFFCSWGGAFWHLPPPLSVGRYYGRLGRFWFEGRQLLLSFPSSGPSRRNRSHFASAVGENVSIFTCLFERCAVLLRLSPHAIYADFAYLFARSRWVDWNNALNYLVMGIIASHIISYPRYSRSVW